MLQIVLNAVRKIINRLNRIKINSIRAKVLNHTKIRLNPAIIITRDQITDKNRKISTECSPICSMIPQMVTMAHPAWPTSMSSRGIPELLTQPPTHRLTWWIRQFQDWMPQTALMDPTRKTSICLGRPAPHNTKWDTKEDLSLIWTWVARSPTAAPAGRDNQTSWMDQRMVASYTQGTAEPLKMYQAAMETQPW